jgi:hypothetical protein
MIAVALVTFSILVTLYCNGKNDCQLFDNIIDTVTTVQPLT